MIRSKVYLLLFCFGWGSLSAQKKPDKIIDSLLAVIKKAKEDTNKAKTWINISQQLMQSGEYTGARSYVDSAFALAEKLNFRKGIANAYSITGQIYQRQSKYPEALKNFSASLIICEEIGFKAGIATAYNNIGSVYKNTGNYPEAIKNFSAALKMSEEIGDKAGSAQSYLHIGNYHNSQGNYPEALKNYSTSLKFYEELGRKDNVAAVNGSIGNMYYYQSNYPQALKAYLASLKVYEELGMKPMMAGGNSNIANVLSSQGNKEEALKRYLIALKIQEEIGDKRGIATTHGNLGNIYYHQGNHTVALQEFFSALKIHEEIGDKEGAALQYFRIGEAYTEQDKYNEALEKFSISLKIYEELGNPVDIADLHCYIGAVFQKQGKISEALKKFMNSLKIYEEAGQGIGIANTNIDIGKALTAQAARKTGPAARFKYNEALRYINKGLKLAQEMQIVNTVMYGYEAMSETYKGMRDYKNALEYYTLAVDLHDSVNHDEATLKLEQQRTQYEVEKAISLEQSKQALKDAEAKALLEKEKEAKQRRTEGYIAGLIGLTLVSIFIIIIIRQRNQKRSAVEKAEAGHKMVELELQSLRAQLNPHFMFNSLNAIQDLIVNENSEKSHLYLSRFSKLLRMLLDNANQPFVSIKHELDLLELYLSLENLRIPNLQYSIEKDPKISAEDRMIPNMMLQPYIENAIWHGLSNKKGERKLQIRIQENGHATEFEVEDNGVGRKRSEELKQQFRHGHHSKGMELLSKRFELLTKEYGSSIQTTVTDLESNGHAAGTLVKIDVPFSLSEQAKLLVNDTHHHN